MSNINRTWCKSELSWAERHYWITVQGIAGTVFEEVVKPFCKKQSLEFISGNGTYAFYNVEGMKLDSEGTTPPGFKRVIAILKTTEEITGEPIGSMMESYPRRKK